MSGLIIFKSGSCLASNAAFFWIASELLKRIGEDNDTIVSTAIRNTLAVAAKEKTNELDLSVSSAAETQLLKTCVEAFITEVKSGQYPFFDNSAKPAYIDLLLEVWSMLNGDLQIKSNCS